MKIKQATTDLEQFRYSLYQNFENRADTLMDLLDAMCSMPEAKSVVEYSLASVFRAQLLNPLQSDRRDGVGGDVVAASAGTLSASSTSMAILAADGGRNASASTLCAYAGRPRHGLSTRGGERQAAGDHRPSVFDGGAGLEAEAGLSSSWVLPLLNQRVATTQDKEMVGAEQISAVVARMTNCPLVAS